MAIFSLKKSDISGNKPSTLEFGELAINYRDGKLFYKNANGEVTEYTNNSVYTNLIFETYADATNAINSILDGQIITCISDNLRYIKRNDWLEVHSEIDNGGTNVKRYGAVGDGSDATAAFNMAAASCIAINNIPPPRGNLPRAPIGNIHVPAGDYLLSSMIDVQGKHINWILDSGANVRNIKYLNGNVIRPGQRHIGTHHGSMDYAVTYAIRGNTDNDAPAEITGISESNQLAIYSDRDSVGLYVDNVSPPAVIDCDTATYTANSVTLPWVPSIDAVRKYRVGMFIDTKHSTKYSGIITGWSPNGRIIYVTDWWMVGDTSSAKIPPDDIGCVVNGFTKVWAVNANIALYADAPATSAAGFELGVFNHKGHSPYNLDDAHLRVWGMDVVNLHPSITSQCAYIARGPFRYAYAAREQENGFYYKGQGNPFKFDNQFGHELYRVGSNGDLILGNNKVTSAPHIVFRSSGNESITDASIGVTGGDGSAYGGTLVIRASSIVPGGNHFRPLTDNTMAMGAASYRWTQVYAATGSIQTSDRREKTLINPIDDKVLDAWGEVSFMVYKWIESVRTKGEDLARWHFGIIAQDVQQAFERHGLDGTKYGLLCYDDFGEIESSQTNNDVLADKKESGGRWGIRPEQCLFLEAAYLRRRCERIEHRLEKLEAK